MSIINNLDIQGEFHLEIKDADTGKVRQVISQKNVITQNFFGSCYITLVSGGGIVVPRLTSLNISFSQANIPNGKRSVTGFGGFIGTAVNDEANAGPKVTFVDSDNSGAFDSIELRQRLGFVGSLYPQNVAYDRTFRTVALTDIISAIDHTIINGSPTYPNNLASGGVWAYVNLDNVFTQKANEVIDVVYRIKTPLALTGYHSKKRLLEDLLYCIDWSNGLHNSGRVESANLRSLSTFPMYGRVPSNEYAEILCFPGDFFGGDVNAIAVNGYGSRKFKITRVVPSSEGSPRLGNYYSVVMSGLISPSLLSKLGKTAVPPITANNYDSPHSPFQSIFSHSPTAFLPFQDDNNLAQGSVRPILAGTWEDNFPEMYRIEILNDGQIGTATYVWQRRKVAEFNGNAFSFSGMRVIYTHQGKTENGKPFPTYHAGTAGKAHDLAYSHTQIVRYDTTGITLLNLVNGDYQSWDSTTIPDLPVTKLRHVDINKTTGKIYAACDDTGLWEIVPGNGGSVVNLVATGCRSVSVGYGDVIWALFWDGNSFSLRNSSNWGADIGNFSFPLSNLNSSNNDCLWFITADASVSNQIALVGTYADTYWRIWWWSLSGGLVQGRNFYANWMNSSNSTDFLESSPKKLVSSKRGFWYTSEFYGFYSARHGGGLLTFGTDGFQWVGGNPPRLCGSYPMLTEDGYLASSLYVHDGVNIVATKLGHSDDWETVFNSTCWLGNNLFFSSSGTYGDYVQPYFYGSEDRINTSNQSTGIDTNDVLNPFVWESFSWDAVNSEWVLSNPAWDGTTWAQQVLTGKPTHLSTDTLIDGITINFEELSNLGLKAGNWYSQVVCLGVLKDNVNNLSYTTNTFLHPTELISSPEIHVIPNTPPYRIVVNRSSRGGVSPEPTFRWLDLTIPLKAEIDGYASEAVIRSDLTAAPGLNEILVNQSNGSLIFNAADGRKTVTINQYFIVKGDESRAIATPNPFAGIHNPTLLLRHDVGVIDDGGGKVTQWSDQSGYNYHPLALVGQEPTLDSSLLVRGLPSIRFNTNYRRLILPENCPIDMSQGFTFAAKVYRYNGNRAWQYVIHIARSSISTGSDLIFGFKGSNFAVYHAPFTGSWVEVAYNDPTYNVWRLYLATYNPDTQRVYLRVDGQPVADGILWGGMGKFQHSGMQSIGAYHLSSGDWTLTGNLSFLAAYNHYLTTKECEALEQEIMNIT